MKIVKIAKKVPLTVTLPDGIYTGLWGGYVIELKYKGEDFELTTDNGVRGINIRVIVTISDGEATFEEVNN